MSEPGNERPEHDGPPWGRWGGGPWRADGGGFGPWDPRDPRAREMRRRARLYRRAEGQRPWRRRQGFGCIFAILFLVVVGSILTATASVLSHLGPVPVVIAAVAIVAIVGALLRGVAGAARDLDSMVAATRRVEAGDYGVRLGSRAPTCHRSRSWPAASTRWSPGSRPTRNNGARSWPT